jgi:glutamine amidotransferase
MLVVIDCGLGNTGSVVNMINKIGGDAIASAAIEDLEKADKLILPGVGKFDYGMQQLKRLCLIDPLNNLVLNKKKPILGICLGVQLFTRKSEEGVLPGLNWIDAETKRFDFSGCNNQKRIPHMGWNTITLKRENPLIDPQEMKQRFYFVHSYHLVCANDEDVVAISTYGYDFVSMVIHDNIMGVQFHPEKSHKYGMHLLQNFLRL